jgi:hypothetical protein
LRAARQEQFATSRATSSKRATKFIDRSVEELDAAQCTHAVSTTSPSRKRALQRALDGDWHMKPQGARRTSSVVVAPSQRK